MSILRACVFKACVCGRVCVRPSACVLGPQSHPPEPAGMGAKGGPHRPLPVCPPAPARLQPAQRPAGPGARPPAGAGEAGHDLQVGNTDAHLDPPCPCPADHAARLAVHSQPSARPTPRPALHDNLNPNPSPACPQAGSQVTLAHSAAGPTDGARTRAPPPTPYPLPATCPAPPGW